MSKYYDLFLKRINKPGRYSWVTANFGEGIRIHSDREDRHLYVLSTEVREKAVKWVEANIFPRKTPFLDSSSYAMKHVLQERTNIYMTNNQFKELMLLCGFYPVKVDELNWHFCISARSPIFQMRKGRFGLTMPECVVEYDDEQKYWASETEAPFLILLEDLL